MKKAERSEVAQLCLILCNLMDCNLPGSSIHGIFQARVLEWGAMSKEGVFLSKACTKLGPVPRLQFYATPLKASFSPILPLWA